MQISRFFRSAKIGKCRKFLRRMIYLNQITSPKTKNIPSSTESAIAGGLIVEMVSA